MIVNRCFARLPGQWQSINEGVYFMKCVFVLLFTVALLSVSLPAGSAVADPVVFNPTNGVCANNPGQATPKLNNGVHGGTANNCKAI